MGSGLCGHQEVEETQNRGQGSSSPSTPTEKKIIKKAPAPVPVPVPVKEKEAKMSDAQNPSTRIMMREHQIAQNSKAKKQGGGDRMAIRGRDLNVEADFKAVNYPKSPDSVKFLDEALSVNFIFSDLNDREKMLLINAMQQHKAQKGDEIIKQGDVGDYFYIVEEGTTDFVVGGNVVGSCTKGASFGELALLYDAPRAASCVAATPCTLWKVDQTTFRHLLAKQNMDQEQDIATLVSKVPLLKDMDKALVAKFASVLQTVKFATDERIVQKGEQGDIFYILNEGQVKVHDIGLGDSQAVDQILKAGDWFGERALMTGEPRAANVTAMTDVVAFAVDRETFEKTIGKMEDILGHAARLRFLKSVPVFASAKLLDVEYARLVDRFKIYKFDKGQKLSEAGKTSAHTMFIVKEGKLRVNNEDGNVLTLRSGDYFGENAILGKSSDTSTDNCICEEKTVCWGLTRSSIEEVIGDVAKLGDAKKFVPSHANPKLQLKDLKKHRILGMGAFGKVWLASEVTKNTPYALKTINKRQLLQANQVKGVVREKQIMGSIDHPLVLGLISSFQDDENLYLLLPLIQGGELFNVIHTKDKDGISNESSVFYGACILDALAHLHDRDIVYRDMKPENALIDAQGYCIMVDLGFAKIVVDKTYTLCGTPEYLAPEIIMSKGHNKAVDYWSFGVLVYEMLVGRSPFYFYGTDQVSLFKRIVMVKYSCPSSVSKDAQDLIKKLLTRRQAARLGSLSGGHYDVREHPWFASIDWKKLTAMEIPAPWKPKIKNPLDTSHFEDFSREEKERDTGRPLSAREQTVFKDF